jgi:hypothetical protein
VRASFDACAVGRIQTDLAIANRELRGMNSHRESTGARIDIVPHDGALPRFIPASLAVECERQRWDHVSGAQMRT